MAPDDLQPSKIRSGKLSLRKRRREKRNIASSSNDGSASVVGGKRPRPPIPSFSPIYDNFDFIERDDTSLKRANDTKSSIVKMALSEYTANDENRINNLQSVQSPIKQQEAILQSIVGKNLSGNVKMDNALSGKKETDASSNEKSESVPKKEIKPVEEKVMAAEAKAVESKCTNEGNSVDLTELKDAVSSSSLHNKLLEQSHAKVKPQDGNKKPIGNSSTIHTSTRVETVGPASPRTVEIHEKQSRGGGGVKPVNIESNCKSKLNEGTRRSNSLDSEVEIDESSSKYFTGIRQKQNQPRKEVKPIKPARKPKPERSPRSSESSNATESTNASASSLGDNSVIGSPSLNDFNVPRAKYLADKETELDKKHTDLLLESKNGQPQRKRVANKSRQAAPKQQSRAKGKPCTLCSTCSCSRGSALQSLEDTAISEHQNPLRRLARSDAEVERALIGRLARLEKSNSYFDNLCIKVNRELKRHRTKIKAEIQQADGPNRPKFLREVDLDDEGEFSAPALSHSIVNRAKHKTFSFRKSEYYYTGAFLSTNTNIVYPSSNFLL